MLEHLYVDGTDLTTFGVFVFDKKTRNAPEKQYTFYDVPGRNGSVLGVERRLKNVTVSYDFVINSNVDTNLSNLRSYLLSRDGYVRIEDSVHTDEYRMGVYSGPLDIKATRDRNMVKGVLEFSCQPQRWLKSGETEIVLSRTLGLNNPTLFEAKPLYRFVFPAAQNGGVITFYYPNQLDSTMIQIDPFPTDTIWIDAESMEAYFMEHGYRYAANQYVLIRTGDVVGVDPPTIPAGGNIDADYNAFDMTPYITPRWWTV